MNLSIGPWCSVRDGRSEGGSGKTSSGAPVCSRGKPAEGASYRMCQLMAPTAEWRSPSSVQCRHMERGSPSNVLAREQTHWWEPSHPPRDRAQHPSAIQKPQCQHLSLPLSLHSVLKMLPIPQVPAMVLPHTALWHQILSLPLLRACPNHIFFMKIT